LTSIPAELSGYHVVVYIVLTNSLDSKNAKLGDPIQAALRDDLIIGGKIYARKGMQVRGHVSLYVPPRTLSQSLLTSDRRLNSRAALQIKFDEIVDANGARIPINGLLSQQSVLLPGPYSHLREIKVDKNGQIIKAEPVLSQGETIAFTTARVATVVPLPIDGLTGIVINVAGIPAAMGLAGAADPSFAYNKPIDPNLKHRRLKAMLYAFLTNLPGAFLVQSVVEKGEQILLKAGDELALDLAVKCEPREMDHRAFTVADVRGAVLSRSDGDRFVVLAAGEGAPVPGAPIPGADGITGDAVVGDGLTAEVPKFDDSHSDISVFNTSIIRPSNGGQRLLPSSSYGCPSGQQATEAPQFGAGGALIQPLTGGRRLVPAVAP
jgi:hypothetical protein